MTITGLVLVMTMVLFFSLRYRKERHPEAVQIEGSTLLEATWTLIPLGIFLVFFVWGALLYFRDLQSSAECHECLRSWQAMDVESGASRRPA